MLAFWRDLFLAVVLGTAFYIFNRQRLLLKSQDRKFILLYGLVLSLSIRCGRYPLLSMAQQSPLFWRTALRRSQLCWGGGYWESGLDG